MNDAAAVADAYFAAVSAHDPDAVQACFADDAELLAGGAAYQDALPSATSIARASPSRT